MSVASDTAARAASAPSDEISLRDLYLILKRRALLIGGLAVVAAIIAFAVVGLQPARYVADATAVIARAPADVDFGSGLRFRPEVNIGLDTYRTLAFSRPVLQELAEMFDLSLTGLESRLDLVTVSTSTAFLAVDHRVRAGDPQEAAALANAWAAISVQRAKDLLLENLDVVESITSEGLAGVRDRVESLEGLFEAFQVRSVERLSEVEVGAVEARNALAERLSDERDAALSAEESRVLRARELRALEGAERLAALEDAAERALAEARSEALASRLAFEVAEESRVLRARELRALEGAERLAALEDAAERALAELRQQQLEERLAFDLTEDVRVLRDRAAFVGGVVASLEGELRGVRNTAASRRALLEALENTVEAQDGLGLVLEFAPEVVVTREGALATLRPLIAALEEREQRLQVELVERRDEVRLLDAEASALEAREASLVRAQGLELEVLVRGQGLERDALARLIAREEAEARGLEESEREARVEAFARALDVELEVLVRGQGLERDALARLIAREEAEARVVETLGLESLEARLERVSAQELARLDAELSVARVGSESRLAREQASLQRSLDDARRDYATLAPLEPGVVLAAQIAPSGARVLSEATPPVDPEGNRALLIALLALVVAGFAGVVMALLAEAVRDPSPTPVRTPPAPEPAAA